MPWVKVDTGYLTHPKIVGLPSRVVVLHLASILWTAEQLTDGYVPDRALISLSSRADLAPNRRRWAARQLVDRGLWDELPGGWHVHDFEIHNRSYTREVVEQKRAAARERQRDHRGNVTPLHRFENE
jgi:hypothetical protein